MDFDIEKLQTLLDGAVASGEEDSCQLAIYKSGRLAVDICAGKNCRSNTLFPVYSVSKGLTSTLAHILYEEGRLDFEAPVSEYWPEFGCNGKEISKSGTFSAIVPVCGRCRSLTNLQIRQTGRRWSNICRTPRRKIPAANAIITV